jgi:hypothetical protein
VSKVNNSIQDLEADLYTDILLVDEAIKKLQVSGSLTAEDVEIIDFVKSGGKLASIKDNTLDKHRSTISKRFNDISERIAFFMGDYFTDDGYIFYIREKYKNRFSEEQIQELESFITNEYDFKKKKKKLNKEKVNAENNNN